jgi:hypothetical protein
MVVVRVEAGAESETSPEVAIMKSMAVEFTTTKSTSVETTAIVEPASHAATMETAGDAATMETATATAAAAKATAAHAASVAASTTATAATSQRHRWRNQANGRNCQ